jgi:hypothetical protein
MSKSTQIGPIMLHIECYQYTNMPTTC